MTLTDLHGHFSNLNTVSQEKAQRQSQTSDFAPDAALWWITEYRPYWRRLCLAYNGKHGVIHKTGSTWRDILHFRLRWEPSHGLTRTENFVKCGHVVFTARRSYASAVLGVVISSVRLSACLSVCLSHACFVTNPKNLPATFLYHMKGQSF